MTSTFYDCPFTLEVEENLAASADIRTNRCRPGVPGVSEALAQFRITKMRHAVAARRRRAKMSPLPSPNWRHRWHVTHHGQILRPTRQGTRFTWHRKCRVASTGGAAARARSRRRRRQLSNQLLVGLPCMSHRIDWAMPSWKIGNCTPSSIGASRGDRCASRGSRCAAHAAAQSDSRKRAGTSPRARSADRTFCVVCREYLGSR